MLCYASAMGHNNTVAMMERLFQGFADRTRLRLLNLMAGREVCVCYFVEILDAPQPTISRHLAYLRRTGLVAARRQGKWMHYRIVPPANVFARQVLMGTLRWLAADREMQRERSLLTKACCSPQKFVKLQKAPSQTPLRELAAGGN